MIEQSGFRRLNIMNVLQADRRAERGPANAAPAKLRPSIRVAAGLLFAVVLAMGAIFSTATRAAAVPPAGIAIGISVAFGPPALPVYAQPYCPGPGYIWTPGYWNWDPNYGYYWVPGTWVPAPYPGALWTPGYWGWEPAYAVFVWNPGYWGPVVGFYGGINYGYGYTGNGYWGGYWRGRNFYYNRNVTNVNVVNITNVYNRTVIVNNRSYVSYNGGRGGIEARPTREQEVAFRRRRMGPVGAQTRQMQWARSNPDARASVNHGRPMIAATARPGDFRGPGVVRANRAGAFYREPAFHGKTRPGAGAAPNNPRKGWNNFHQANSPESHQNGGGQNKGRQGGWQKFNQAPSGQGGNGGNNRPAFQRGGPQGNNSGGYGGNQPQNRNQGGGKRQMKSRPQPKNANQNKKGGDKKRNQGHGGHRG